MNNRFKNHAPTNLNVTDFEARVFHVGILAIGARSMTFPRQTRADQRRILDQHLPANLEKSSSLELVLERNRPPFKHQCDTNGLGATFRIIDCA